MLPTCWGWGPGSQGLGTTVSHSLDTDRGVALCLAPDLVPAQRGAQAQSHIEQAMAGRGGQARARDGQRWAIAGQGGQGQARADRGRPGRAGPGQGGKGRQGGQG